MTFPIARSRQRGIATNEIGIVAVILLIVGVLTYRGCVGTTDSALECVATAARITAGASPQGVKCPVSKAPFASPVCADPKNHLRWPPRFEGKRPQQDLPAPPKVATMEIGRKASYIVAREEPRLIVEVRPRIWWRYVVGPIVQILCLLYIVAFFFQLSPKDRGPTGVIVTSLVVMLLSIWLLWITVPTVEGSRSLEFDLTGGKIIHHRYVFGWELSPQVYGPESLSFVRTRTGWSESYSLVLVHWPAGEARALELIDNLSERDAVLCSWLKERFILLR